MYNYTNSTLVSQVNCDVYSGWFDCSREALRLAVDDECLQVEIESYWKREPNGEIRIVKVGALVLGLIYGEVPDLLTIQDWVIDFEDRLNEIAADYDRDTTWYLEDQAILAELAQLRREQG